MDSTACRERRQRSWDNSTASTEGQRKKKPEEGVGGKRKYVPANSNGNHCEKGCAAEVPSTRKSSRPNKMAAVALADLRSPAASVEHPVEPFPTLQQGVHLFACTGRQTRIKNHFVEIQRITTTEVPGTSFERTQTALVVLQNKIAEFSTLCDKKAAFRERSTSLHAC